MDIKDIFFICNIFLTGFFVACYLYQFFYVFYVLFKKSELPPPKEIKMNKFGIVICARNEENMIGNLLQSVNRQDYPQELMKVFLVADNCDDGTADVGRRYGANVLERFDKEKVGKGYALDTLFKKLLAEGDDCDAYIIFDADNLVDKSFVREMNINFNRGFIALTSYRNSKNYGTNWISAGYSLWFLREAKYLNNARMHLGASCAISGTGFCISRKVIERDNGWKYHLLTEDVEFSVDMAIQGEKIGYSGGSVVYDEQPETFKQSWNQRLRWAKGFYQVFGKYGKNLFKGIFKGSFACYDMLMTIFPAIMVTILSLICCLAECIYGITLYAAEPHFLTLVTFCIVPLVYFLTIIYMLMFVVGFITVVTEWDSINCPPGKIVKYLFTFPIFMLTYVPIAIAAMFKKVEWTPIKHNVEMSIDDVDK